jgi:surface protein
MASMFNGCTNFNQDISTWITSLVVNMQSMFTSCTNFNQPLNSWIVSNVTKYE